MTEKREIVWHQGEVTPAERQGMLGLAHQPFVYWLVRCWQVNTRFCLGAAFDKQGNTEYCTGW